MTFNFLRVLSLTFIISCSSASAKWETIQVNFKKQTWRICDKVTDGEELHLKGFCYWQKEIKKKSFQRDEIRRVQKVCLFSDYTCLEKFQLSGKVIL